jgi:hypothetical protein
MKPEVIIPIVALAIWLFGTAIALARRGRHADIRDRFWGPAIMTGGKIIVFAMLWPLWGVWALVVDGK